MKKLMKHHSLATLLITVLLLSACGNLNPSEAPAQTSELLSFEETLTADPVDADLAATVAQLELDGGGSLTFLDLGNGDVGIAERSPRGRASVLGTLLERNATPLEVYLALESDDAELPQQLVQDHERQSAEPPRNLKASLGSLSPQGLDDPGKDTHYCDYYEWTWDWHDTFVPLTDYQPAGSGHIINAGSQFTFYPGAHVYHGTNTNQVTYLGACSRDKGGDTMTFEIHRWLPTYVFNPYPQPPTVSWSWKKISTVSIEGYETYTFYSGVQARYRGRVKALGNAVNGFSIGAAYTKTPPIGFAP